MTTAHPDWATLNDYADGVLPAAAREHTARHLGTCDECRALLERVQSVVVRAQTATGSIAPPPGAWAAVRDRIEQRKVVPLPAAPAARRHRPRLQMAAAAVLLVVASSTVTVLVVNRGEAPTPQAAAAPGGSSDVHLVALSGDMAVAERGYLGTVEELTAVLDESRTRLAPETVRAIERSLVVIDEAIAEAREALLNDPANITVRDLLKKGYEQKVDLLRRATTRLLET